jgi:hypothetical protein
VGIGLFLSGRIVSETEDLVVERYNTTANK